MMNIPLEYIDNSLKLNIAIHVIYIIISCYAGIMLNAFSDPLCSKLCWHNRQVPTNNPKSIHAMIGTEKVLCMMVYMCAFKLMIR